MLKKANRLNSKLAFKATYNNNHSVSDSLIVLYIGQKKDDENCPTRVGFVVSKKIHKRAVVRNAVKRKMRESVRLLLKKNALPNEYKSLIFIAKSSIQDKNYSQIETSVNNLLSKIANKNI